MSTGAYGVRVAASGSPLLRRRRLALPFCGAWFLLAGLTASVCYAQTQGTGKRVELEDRQISVSGEVRDQAGRSIAGASVWLVRQDSRLEHPPQRFAETRSGDDGKFSFAELSVQDLGEDVLKLIARDSAGRLGWSVDWLEPRGNVIRPHNVRDVRGRVVDAAGEPVAGARLTVQMCIVPVPGQSGSTNYLQPFAELAAQLEARTTSDGRFVLPHIPEQTRLGCDVSAPDYPTCRALFNAQNDVTIKLSGRPGVIVGALAPLEGIDVPRGGYRLRATLQQSSTPSSEEGLVRLSCIRELMTDDDGKFRGDDFLPGRYSIERITGQGRRFVAWPPAQVEVKPGATIDPISIPLSPTLRVAGRVVDRESGEGIERVEVYGTQLGSQGDSVVPPDSHSATTDAAGRYELHLPPNRTAVAVRRVPSGFLPPQSSNGPYQELHGNLEWPDYELSRAVQAEGLVIDQDGRPAPHAELYIDLRQRSRHAVRNWPPSESDAQGRFIIHQVDPEEKFSLRARTADAVTYGLKTVVPSKLKGPVTLRLLKHRVFRLRGRVVDDTDRGVPGAELAIEWERRVYDGAERLPRSIRRQGSLERSRRSQLERRFSDANGGFESSALWSEDNYRLIVSAHGYAPLETSQVTGVSGDVHNFGNLVLKRNDFVVSGMVVDEEGRTVADAEVQILASAGAAQPSQRSDAKGQFTLTGIDASGPLTLRARTAAAVTNGAKVVLPADFDKPVHLVVSAKHAFRLRGTVTDRQGQAAAGASVSVYWDRRVPEQPTTRFASRRSKRETGPVELDRFNVEPDGAFETPPLWPDENYHVVAVAPGFASAESSVVFGPVGEISVLPPLALTRNDLKLVGRVLDSAGKPLAGASVINSGDAPQRLAILTGADGGFAMQGVYEGPAHLLARLEGYRPAGWRGAAGSEAIEIVLSPESEPLAPVALEPLDWSARHVREQLFARRLLDELWELRERFDDNPLTAASARARRRSGRRSAETDTVARLAEIMACLDLDQALRWSAAEGGRLDEKVRIAAVRGDYQDDVPRALQLLTGMKAYGAKSALFQMAHRQLAAGKREPAIQLLEAVLTTVPRESVFSPADPEWQVSELATTRAAVGALMIRAGGDERGRELLLQAAAAAEGASTGGQGAQTRGAVAADLAAIDPGRARRLLESIRDPNANGPDYAAHAAAIAAARGLDPERQLLKLAELRQDADRARMKIAYALARRDLAAAERLVKGISDDNLRIKSDALGWLAVAEVDDKPAKAYALIDRSLELYLDASSFYRGRTDFGGPPAEAARIALAAQSVGYPDLPNVVDRVLAMRLTADRVGSPGERVVSTVSVARLLALVDLPIARELLVSAEPQAGLIERSDGQGGIGRGEWLQAWALVDLDEAERRCNAELAELRERPSVAAASIDMLPLLEMLVVPPDKRERFLLHSVDMRYGRDPLYWFPTDE